MFFQLSQLIVNAGGVAAVVDYVGESKGNVRLPGIMMLGYVAAHSENLAMAVIVSKVKTVCASLIVLIKRINSSYVICPLAQKQYSFKCYRTKKQIETFHINPSNYFLTWCL